jgi:hypothetical protein
MLYQDSKGRRLLAQEHAARLARDYGRLGGLAEWQLALDLARFLSRRRRRRLGLYRARARSA